MKRRAPAETEVSAGLSWTGKLNALAALAHGYITTRAVTELGIDPSWLSKLEASGRLERRAHGVYRIIGWPTSRLDEFQLAVLWATQRGAIAGEAALDMWELADVNPRYIDIVVEQSYRPRKALGEVYRVRRRNIPDSMITEIEGIQVLSPYAAIKDCIALGTGSRMITQAIDNARRRELITRYEDAQLVLDLHARETS